MSASDSEVGPVKGLLVLGGMVLSAVAAIGLALGCLYFWHGRAQPTAWDRIDGTGTELVVHFLGSECQSSSRVEAEEHADRVVITAYEGIRAPSCSDVGVPYELTLILDDPLGDRDLVDGMWLRDPGPNAGRP